MKRPAAAMKRPAAALAVAEMRFGFARQRADGNTGRIYVRRVGQRWQLPGETESSTGRRGQTSRGYQNHIHYDALYP